MKIKRGKVSSVCGMRQDLSNQLLKLITGQLVCVGASAVMLRNDFCSEESAKLAPGSWFNFLLQHLRTVIALVLR